MDEKDRELQELRRQVESIKVEPVHVMTGCEIVWRYVPDSETDYWQSDKRPKWCPLVEVPTPHGHLIDGEVLWDTLRYGYDVDLSELPETLAALLEMIDGQPTIIEAEEGEEA